MSQNVLQKDQGGRKGGIFSVAQASRDDQAQGSDEFTAKMGEGADISHLAALASGDEDSKGNGAAGDVEDTGGTSAAATFDVEGSGKSTAAERREAKNAQRKARAEKVAGAAVSGAGTIKAVKELLFGWIERQTMADKLPQLQFVFVGMQIFMYIVWVVMWQGWVTNQILPTMQAICFAYVFVFVDQIMKWPNYKKKCTRIKFEKGSEIEFYNSAFSQLKFHGLMVMQPLVIMVVDTLLFTYSFIEGCNYYNVRVPPEDFVTNLTAYAAVGGSRRGCTDSRALNFNPDATEHEFGRCDFVRCHQDVYQFRNDWPIGIKIFAPLYVTVFFLLVLSSLLLSYGHLKYFESLYMERYKAMPFLKQMWRNAVASYTVGTGKVEKFFGADKLRLFHGLLLVTQAILTAAMVVGKLSIQENWFIEFDISVLILGYECGRHAPPKEFIKKSKGNYDIYLMTERLKWHRGSMYHYFLVCAAQAYLSVSGGYRIMPGDDYNNDEYLREIVINAFGAEVANVPSVEWMTCPSGLSANTRLAGAGVISSLFLFVVGLSGWLSICHYLQYQNLKREHTVLLSFAAGFKAMLQRRRRRITYALTNFDESSGELCPEGGFPVEHESTDNPRRTRGKVVITENELIFCKAGGIPELDGVIYLVGQLLTTRNVSGTPPSVIVTLQEHDPELHTNKTFTFISRMARAISGSIDRVIEEYADRDPEERERAAKKAGEKQKARLRRKERKMGAGGPAGGEVPAGGPMDPMQMMMMQQQMMMQQMMQQQQQQGGGVDPMQMMRMQQQMMQQQQQQPASV